MGWRSFKNFLLKNHETRRAHIFIKAFLYNVDSSLYKSSSGPQGLGGATIEKTIFILKKSSSSGPAGQFQ
jgi:hypothetical protein